MKILIQKILAALSRKIIRKYNPDIVAITGSVGKTTAKEATVSVLSETFSVRGNEKSYNNELGVPLTIIGMHAQARSFFGWLRVFARALSLILWTDRHYPSILVLEMGADAPGDIERLVSIAPPKIGVITAIGPTHLEKLESLERLVEEKKKIFCRHTRADQWMVVNADDPALYPIAEKTPACVLTYGQHPDATLRISDIHEHYAFHPVRSSPPIGPSGAQSAGVTSIGVHPDQKEYVSGLACTLTYKGDSVRVELPHAVGRHILPSIVAGAASGCIYNIPLSEIAHRLYRAKPAPGRMHLIPGIRDTLLIDDTYNSSPNAARGAIDVLMSFEIDAHARRIAVLGDMRELGSHTEREHRNVGSYVANAGVDYFFAVGQAASFFADGAREGGLDDARIFVFNDSMSAGRALQDFMKKGDVILLKGSQNIIRLERVVKEIMAEPYRAEELLVRQDSEWQ